MSKILVLGASGTLGNEIVCQLISNCSDQQEVLCGVRDLTSERALKLSANGAKCVEFDLCDSSSWKGAFKDVERLFLNLSDTELPSVNSFARCVSEAKATGVRSVVRLSDITAEHTTSSSGRLHSAYDDIVANTGFDHYTICRPTFYMENFFAEGGPAAASANDVKLYGIVGSGAIPYVSGSDVAAVCVAAVLDPRTHNRNHYAITGGLSLTNEELAQELTIHLGKAVTNVELEEYEFRMLWRGTGIPNNQVENLIAIERLKRSGAIAKTSSVVQEILGREPETFSQFLTRKRGHGSVDDDHFSLTHSSKNSILMGRLPRFWVRRMSIWHRKKKSMTISTLLETELNEFI